MPVKEVNLYLHLSVCIPLDVCIHTQIWDDAVFFCLVI